MDPYCEFCGGCGEVDCCGHFCDWCTDIDELKKELGDAVKFVKVDDAVLIYFVDVKDLEV